MKRPYQKPPLILIGITIYHFTIFYGELQVVRQVKLLDNVFHLYYNTLIKAVRRMVEQLRLEKIIGMALLSDFYGPLLTEKQRQALHLFYDEDYSLSEIAAQCNCTRQAAHELIKRSEALLADYEQKLGLIAKHQQRQSLLKQVEQELTTLGLSRGWEGAGALWRVLEEMINNER
jgi:predicted DNA-binding protein YlxM (UPF0122 family)